MRLKYIVVDGSIGDTPFIFPEWINHVDFALTQVNSKDKILSAGFCEIYVTQNGDIKYSAYGKSVSLNLESDPERDSNLLTRIYGRVDD